MNLEDQQPYSRFIAELIKQEEERLLQGNCLYNGEFPMGMKILESLNFRIFDCKNLHIFPKLGSLQITGKR